MPPWHSHEPIALEALDALQDRVDVKYVIGMDTFEALASELRGSHGVLEIGGRREFTYRTTYFDTPDLQVFRDHQQRRRRRYKARSREYVDSGARTFEVKLKGARGRTVKHRMPYDRDGLSGPALAFLRDTVRREYGRSPEPGLRSALEVVYRRVTFAAPGERLTCDFDLRFGGGARLAPGRVIVESKSAHGNAVADRILRALGERPEEGCSKYCLGVALTDPRAKRNGLRRLLRKHFLVAALALPAALPATANAELPVLKIQAPAAIPDGKKAKASLRMPGYSGQIGIERRGHSSQRFPKKSFSIELRDARGKDRKVGLLGLPADGDWVLYAPYNDKTLMRNALAYETARSLGRYAPRTRFVELHLNRRYHGIYVLTEKVELGDERVDGKALVEFTFPVQAPTQGASFRGPVRKRPVVWADPAREDSHASRLMPSRRRSARPSARSTAAAAGGRTSTRPRRSTSCCCRSCSRTRTRSSAARSWRCAGTASCTSARSGTSTSPSATPAAGPRAGSRAGSSSAVTGPGRLLQDPRFARGLSARWKELRAAGLQQNLHRAIDANVLELRGELERNFTRWPVLHRRLWPSAAARGSHGAEVRHLRSWLDRRIAWIDRNV